MSGSVSLLSLTAAVAVVLPCSALADTRTATPSLTLDLALRRAFENSPVLGEARALVAEAEGRRRSAGALLNPELSARGAARIRDDATRPDFGAEVTQPIPLGSARSDRVRVAESEIAEAEARHQVARQALATRVHVAFIGATRAQDLAALASAGVTLSQRLLLAAERRLDAGNATLLDVYVSRAELGRSENFLQEAQAEAFAARVVLAEVMGDDPTTPPFAASIPAPDGPLPALDEVLGSARARRADLAALRAAIETARKRRELAGSIAIPNLSVSAFFEIEGGSEIIIGGGLGLPIPIFDRNQGGVAEATAATERSEAALVRADLELTREITIAHQMYRSALAADRAFESRVVGTLEETVDLLQRSFDAGKIGFTDLLVLRRSLLEARAVAVETRARVATAKVTLDVALGRIALP